MPELRVDTLTGHKAIVAAERATRPGGGLRADPAPAVDVESDPFAEGHEDRTPPEVYAVRPGGGEPNSPGWTIRVVPNLFPALTPDGPAPSPEANPDLFAAQAASGAHEVIVNGPQPVSALCELPANQVVAALDAWRERIRAHHGARCVHVMVNERTEAGSSLPHTHAQLYAMEFVPADVARERERFAAHAARTMGRNLLEDLVQEEVRRRTRLVAVDDEAVVVAPYASRVPYQLMLAPRATRARFEDDGPTGAALLHDALSRLARVLGASPPLNLWVRTAPRGAEHFCWRIDVLPRLSQLAGLELGTGVHINAVPPEVAAEELRAA